MVRSIRFLEHLSLVVILLLPCRLKSGREMSVDGYAETCQERVPGMSGCSPG